MDMDYIIEKIIRAEILKGNLINIKIKKRFFQKVKNKFGRLKCQICNNDDLIEIGKNGKQPHNLATIEHVIPISQGGLRYVDSNYICTCSKCNGERGDKPMFYIGNDMYIF